MNKIDVTKFLHNVPGDNGAIRISIGTDNNGKSVYYLSVKNKKVLKEFIAKLIEAL